MTNHLQNNMALSGLLAEIEKKLDITKKDPIDATAWFLGPKAENAEALYDLVKLAVKGQVETRLSYMPQDPSIFDKHSDEKSKKAHAKSIEIITKELELLLSQLQGSIPLASYRNQSHMYWDITLPGIVGYFAAMLYNQNNVATEASPVTTALEMQVGKDLCEMLGFNQSPVVDEGVEFRKIQTLNIQPQNIQSWGHITCDGSIANGESMWAARNLKFLPIAMAAAIATEPELAAAKVVVVKTCQGKSVHLIDASIWELLNLPVDEVLGLVEKIEVQSGLDPAMVRWAVDNFSVQNLGLVQFQLRFLDTYTQAMPVVLVPATAHYSWPKTAALLGLGTHAVKLIEIDLDGRMSMVALRRELDECLNTGRPVMQVVAVMGSTEEGAVDPLADIIRMRKDYQDLGLSFAIHADAAWGGYFTSVLRKMPSPPRGDPAISIDSHPDLFVNAYFKTHFEALADVDSVTLDPHKSGFIPYPAGSLCYRNASMRNLIAFTAPVVVHGDIGTVGPYGIEGSKPGAAAASVYLSHKVIPLNNEGYGRMLGRCLFNSKRFYAALQSMDLASAKGQQAKFSITAIQRLPAEKNEAATHKEILAQKTFLKEQIVPYSTCDLINKQFGYDVTKKYTPQQIVQQKKTLELFKSIGSDLSIISYAFNFKKNASLNTDLKLMNELNENIFNVLSLPLYDPDSDSDGDSGSNTGKIPEVEMFVTSSALDPAGCGYALTNDFCRRAGVNPEGDTPVTFLISTTQNPWLSTAVKDSNGKIINMIDVLIKVLTRTVNAEVDKILNKYNLNHTEIKPEEAS